MVDDVEFDDEEPNVLLDHPFCPTCGQRTKLGLNPEWLLTHFNGEVYPAVLAKLCEARRIRKGVSLTDLCRAAYHNDPKGGPAWGPNVIQQRIAQNQAKLATLGWAIVGPQTTCNGFQLVPFDVVEGLV